jgi:hypothetical protein
MGVRENRTSIEHPGDSPFIILTEAREIVVAELVDQKGEDKLRPARLLRLFPLLSRGRKTGEENG